mgnify:FL=1
MDKSSDRMGVPNESELSSNSCISERTKRRVVLHIVRYLVEITKRFSEEDRRDIICRVLHHQSLNEDMERIKFRDQCVSEEIVESMKSSLDLVKGVESLDKLAAKRAALHMVVNGAREKKYSDTKVALALGIQRRNLRKHRQNIHSNKFKWMGLGRRRRCDALSQEIIEKVDSFWAKNTRVSPNKKDVCRQRISQGKYQIHPRHFLEMTEVFHFFISIHIP